MENLKNDKPSRRKFLSLSLLGGASLAVGKATAQTVGPSGEKVKMLTPDGQLVEVDKNVLEKSSDRQKASNKAIFDWAKPEGEI
ncbi:MAG: twin-arginine translocation signal domain-containing protein [Bacteroidetes bacterium]|nr:twin-arginine translocation signal domain-containing protein [Bacteroidota bacterium]